MGRAAMKPQWPGTGLATMCPFVGGPKPMKLRRAGALIPAALLASLWLACPAAAEQPQVPMLTASGDGSVMVVPDIAVVTIGVASRARTAGALDGGNRRGEIGGV